MNKISVPLAWDTSNGCAPYNLLPRIDASREIKVADFGLSESIHSTNYFRQEPSEEAKLPVKWMAPESLSDDIFTEATDVVRDTLF